MYDISAPNGSGVSVLDYGATVVEVRVPDREGRIVNVALGYQDVSAYETNGAYLGALLGRLAGRTSGASFVVDGTGVHLPSNEGRVHRHGGPIGFHRRMYDTEIVDGSRDAASLIFRRTSPIGEDGYPATVDVEVTVTWTASHTLRFRAVAKADGTTPISLTHHGWWNLAGDGSGSIDRHALRIDADAYLPMRSQLVADGSVARVDGSLLDFREPVHLAGLLAGGGRLDPTFPATDVRPSVRELQGIDHAFVTVPAARTLRREVAALSEPISGRRMRVLTTEPVLHVHTGHILDGQGVGRSGKALMPYGGIALVPMGYPNAVHHPHFPTPFIRPGETYQTETSFVFDHV